MSEHSVIVAWIIRELYNNSPAEASKATGFSVQQLKAWQTGTRKPQKGNISRLMHHAFEPNFTIIAEFKRLDADGDETIHSQLSKILKGFHKASGVYAFYDSSGNLLYIGKADGTLLAEAYTQIKANVTKAVLPRGVPQPKARLDIVQYISAYRVNKSEFEDYAKHVEALILRISKLPLNKNTGKLEKAQPNADDK